MTPPRRTWTLLLLALAAFLAPEAEASRTSVQERNPPAFLTATRADAAGLLASLAPAAAADIETDEPPRFDLGDVVLAEDALEHEERFGLGPLELLGPAPLRGPPPSYPETRVRGFELLPPFRVGASASLSLWGRQACGFPCLGLVSDSRYDPWGLAGTPARAPVMPPRPARRSSEPTTRRWRSPEYEGRGPRGEVRPVEPIQLHPPYISGDDFTAFIRAQNQLPEPETTLGAPPDFRGFTLTEEELDSPYLTQLRSADPNSDEYHQLYALHRSWLDDKRSGGFGPGPTAAKLRHPDYERKLYSKIPKKTRKAVLPRDAVVPCAYCGNPADTIDHVESQKQHYVKRGKVQPRKVRSAEVNKPENLVPACRPCNSSKQDKSLEEWSPPLPPASPGEGE